MNDARRTTRLRAALARGASALLVVAAVAAVVVLGGVRAVPQAIDVPAAEVEVPATATDLVCPAPPRLATEEESGGDAAYDPQFDPEPGDAVSEVTAVSVAPAGADDAASGRLDALGAASTQAALATLEPAAGAAAATVAGAAGSVVVHLDAAQDAPAWGAAAIGVLTAAGDLRGLVAASCRPASAETWLVGGSTSLGSSARLVLVNPGSTAATVSLELWGASGPVELAGAAEYLVPPGSERAVLLEGVAAEQPRIVAHVTASGGLVAAYLQDSELRGLVPAGVDDVVGGQEPAVTQVVPGVSVVATPAGGADAGVLRVLAPHESGTATVTLLGADGEVALPGADGIELEAGAVLDIPLGGLAAGRYTAVVEADVAVVAGAMVTRGAGVGAAEVDSSSFDAPALDRAWAASSAVGAAGALALPSVATGRLLVSAIDDADTTGPLVAAIDVVGQDGAVLATTDVRVEQGTTTELDLADVLDTDETVAGVVMRSDDPRLVWAAVLEVADKAGGLVSVLTPVPPQADEPVVRVRVR